MIRIWKGIAKLSLRLCSSAASFTLTHDLAGAKNSYNGHQMIIIIIFVIIFIIFVIIFIILMIMLMIASLQHSLCSFHAWQGFATPLFHHWKYLYLYLYLYLQPH